MTALIGPIIGPLSPASGSDAAAPEGVDFAIGDLGFRLAINDERPYERATAQFRKEQVDNSGSYGDQSLVGYWTRGQFSFHKGAGLKYYEVLDGESVLNRYNEGVGVNPFTPGEVSLDQDWDTTTDEVFADITFAGAGKDFLAFLDDGVLKHATTLTGSTTDYTPTAGTVTHAAVGPLCAYVATSDNNIERVGIATGAPSSALTYTHSTAFKGLFYAKDRLWAVDDTGTWYQLAPNPSTPPVAIDSGDLVFAAGDTWDDTWTLADTPGPVLIANGSHVYAVSVDADGAIPTLSGPVQVAELPTGETVRGLAHHLGFLVLATSAGLRVGIVADSGSVTYGPLIVEWDSTPTSTTLALRGSSAFVSGGGSLYEVSLAQQVGEGLEFGWTELVSPFGADPAYGAFTFDGTTLVAWSTTGAVHESLDLTPAGTLLTGFHRFGTVERKKFQNVFLRTAGTGSITVTRVNVDGSEVSLYTQVVGGPVSQTIPLGLKDPTEMVALRFTLMRDSLDSTQGPTLLGYQVRALPAPKRQRMIRLPLMLMDVENSPGQPATGGAGRAWGRLAELEDMEQSGGTFTFTDFRTGETGECYIESVEHAGKTPPGINDSGFGGIVFLTLRKL